MQLKQSTVIVPVVPFWLLRPRPHRARGYWRQWADEGIGDSPRWIREPSVVRDKDGRPPRGPSDSALLLCVAGVYYWEISLG